MMFCTADQMHNSIKVRIPESSVSFWRKLAASKLLSNVNLKLFTEQAQKTRVKIFFSEI